MLYTILFDNLAVDSLHFNPTLRYKGNHVSPTEIENILQEHPAVNDCLVFGKKDDTVQELISAVVTLKTGEHVNNSI